MMPYYIKIILLIPFCIVAGCISQQDPDISDLPPTMTPEIATDLELFAKWCFAHFIQNDRIFLLDIPQKGYDFWTEGITEQEIENYSYDSLEIPVETLMNHIVITEVGEYNSNKYFVWLKLDEEGRRMLIENYPELTRMESWSNRLEIGTYYTFELSNGKVTLINDSPSEWSS